MSAVPALQLLARGVWRAPYLVDDVPVLIAVDRFGVVRKHVKLRDGVDVDRAAEWLAELLDRVDPPLRLVKPIPASQPPRVIDPRLYTDPRSPLARRRYVNNLVTRGSRALPRRPAD
jgi:hypothetical protein